MPAVWSLKAHHEKATQVDNDQRAPLSGMVVAANFLCRFGAQAASRSMASLRLGPMRVPQREAEAAYGARLVGST
jgi:hypothetical protein